MMGTRRDGDEVARLLIKGFISDLPEETQRDIEKCRLEMLDVIGRYDDGVGYIALGLIGSTLKD